MEPSDWNIDGGEDAGESRGEGQLGSSSSASPQRRPGEGDEGIGWSEEEGLIQWLRALELQVVGGCRADERLKPLLKFNVSSGAAEDRLLAQLNQHFEVSEIGMLMRCLCIPLVSIRVGKVNKQGNLFHPIATRGHLNLNILPSSNMQISFTGDDGYRERLALLNNDSDSSDALVEELTADSSGRCFVLKIPSSRLLYYWCSEKSKQYGRELLLKMKDLLQRKPSLSDLTGIPQRRLDAFVIHLRACNIGRSNLTAISTSSSDLCGFSENVNCQPLCINSKFSCDTVTSSQLGDGHSFCHNHNSLDLGSDIFENGTHIKNGVMEKLKLCGHSDLSSIDPGFLSSSCTGTLSTGVQEDDKQSGAEPSSDPYCHDIPSMSSPLVLSNPFFHLPSTQLSVPSIEFSPHYCWCPPGPSLPKSTAACQPVKSSKFLPLPTSLSALLSDASPAVSSLPSKLPTDFAELQAITLPSLHLDPTILPIPISATSITLSSSQQIPTFTPFMSDPIVHIPVIDICSSGQGYLVSGGPAISSVISPLLPVHGNLLIPKTESAAEKSARETIEMLIASAPTPFKLTLGNEMPIVLDSRKNLPSNVNKNDTVAVASQSSFSDDFDVDALTSSTAWSKQVEFDDEEDYGAQFETPDSRAYK